MHIIFSVTMTLLWGFSLILADFAPLASAEQGKSAKTLFTKHFKESLFDITEKGQFSIEILLDDKEYKIGKDVIGIVVHNARDQDVEKAVIEVDLRDLDTGQSAAQAPVVKEKGHGLYTVSSLDLKREGRSKLSITVRKDNLADSVQFLFPEVLNKRWPPGRYSP